jgi:hypothetical protein
MPDWVKIRTEYVTTEASYRELAAKYGVSTVQLARHGKDEKWVEQREQFQHKTITKTLEKVSEKTARQKAKVSTLADKLLCKLEQAIDELDLNITTQKVKTEEGNTETTIEFKVAKPGGIVDRAGLRQLTAALKELQAIKGEITELERREREARIEALRKAAMTDSDDDDTGVILMAPRREKADG